MSLVLEGAGSPWALHLGPLGENLCSERELGQGQSEAIVLSLHS